VRSSPNLLWSWQQQQEQQQHHHQQQQQQQQQKDNSNKTRTSIIDLVLVSSWLSALIKVTGSFKDAT